MKKAPIILLILLLAFTAWARKVDEKQTAQATNQKAKPRHNYVPVYLGHSDLKGGPISKTMFDSLMRQGLTAHDSMGNVFSIDGFIFTYAEKKLYEDSAANLVFITDLLSEYCPGDTLTSNISSTLYDRTKEGDTVYFDAIRLKAAQGWNADGKPMHFEITGTGH